MYIYELLPYIFTLRVQITIYWNRLLWDSTLCRIKLAF